MCETTLPEHSMSGRMRTIDGMIREMCRRYPDYEHDECDCVGEDE